MGDYDNASLDALEKKYLRSTIPRFVAGALAGFVVEPLVDGHPHNAQSTLEMIIREMLQVTIIYSTATASEQLALGKQGSLSRGAAWTAGIYFGATAYQTVKRYLS